MCPAFKLKGGVERVPVSAVSQLPSAQYDPMSIQLLVAVFFCCLLQGAITNLTSIILFQLLLKFI